MGDRVLDRRGDEVVPATPQTSARPAHADQGLLIDWEPDAEGWRGLDALATRVTAPAAKPWLVDFDVEVAAASASGSGLVAREPGMVNFTVEVGGESDGPELVGAGHGPAPLDLTGAPRRRA